MTAEDREELAAVAVSEPATAAARLGYIAQGDRGEEREEQRPN